MDAAAFDAMAKGAEGKCPVSNALRASLTIEVETSVR
jgi:organic hydroperoxide reductase OsmC/OhrA